MAKIAETARRVVELEAELERLKRENAKLRKRLRELEAPAPAGE